LTPEFLEAYLTAAGLTCPAGHLLKAVPSIWPYAHTVPPAAVSFR